MGARRDVKNSRPNKLTLRWRNYIQVHFKSAKQRALHIFVLASQDVRKRRNNGFHRISIEAHHNLELTGTSTSQSDVCGRASYLWSSDKKFIFVENMAFSLVELTRGHVLPGSPSCSGLLVPTSATHYANLAKGATLSTSVCSRNVLTLTASISGIYFSTKHVWVKSG